MARAKNFNLDEFAIINGVRYQAVIRAEKVFGEFLDWNTGDASTENNKNKEKSWFYSGAAKISDKLEGYDFYLGFETDHFPITKDYSVEQAIIRSAQKISEDIPTANKLIDYSLENLIEQLQENEKKVISCDNPGEIPIASISYIAFFIPTAKGCVLTNHQVYKNQ